MFVRGEDEFFIVEVSNLGLVFVGIDILSWILILLFLYVVVVVFFLCLYCGDFCLLLLFNYILLVGF